MNRTRFMSLLLAVVMVAMCFTLVACGGGNGGTETGDNKGGKVTEPAVTEEVLPEKMEGVNYNGETFTILISSRSTRTPNDFDSTDTSTVMGSAAYKRNSVMYDTYGVEIEVILDLNAANNGYNLISTEFNAGTYSYDMGIVNTYCVAPLTTEGFLYDLNEIPYLDMTKPWWDKTIVDDLTISGSLYFASGKISTTVDDYTYTTIFNKDMFETKTGEKPEVLYQLVKDGKWTMDALDSYAKLVCEDVNGDNVYDSRDKYGLETWNDILFASIQASGERVAQVNSEGHVELCLYNDRSIAAAEKFLTMEQAEYSINFQKKDQMAGDVTWPGIFSNGQALFLTSLLNEVSRFRNMETDYGILPNAKLDETQTNYFCSISAGLASFICVPILQEDIERTGIIMELLGYTALDSITPAYYEKTLVGTYVRDDESVEMLDIMFANKFVDLGHYYRIGGYNSQLYNVANTGSDIGAFSTMYETYLPKAETDIATINSQLDKLKANY